MVLQDLEQHFGINFRRVFQRQFVKRRSNLGLYYITFFTFKIINLKISKWFYVFKSFVEALSCHIPEDHVILVDLPLKKNNDNEKILSY